MGSTFSTYNIGYSGLRTYQSALNATSQNISNVNTTGYSRLQVVSESVSGSGNSLNATIGDGADIQEIKRVSDQLLNASYWKKNSTLNYWSTKNETITDMEQLLNDYSTSTSSTDSTSTTNTGLQSMISDFFDKWKSLSEDPSDTSARQEVLDSADSLISTLSTINQKLLSMQQESYSDLTTSVSNLNDYAAQVATLNTQINKAELDGTTEASVLRDQRDQVIDEMSALAGISVNVGSDGNYNISVSGITLVNGDKSYALSVKGDGTSSNPVQVWSDSFDTAVKISGGSMQSQIEDANDCDLTDITASPLSATVASDSTTGYASDDISIPTTSTLSLGGTYTVGVSGSAGSYTFSLYSGSSATGTPLATTTSTSLTGTAISFTSGGTTLATFNHSGTLTTGTTTFTTSYDLTLSSTATVSQFRESLNDLVTTLATQINSLHETGEGLDGTTGLAFFVAKDTSKSISIDNIAVNSVLTNDTNKLAAGTTGQSGDNTIASAIYNIQSDKTYQYNGLTVDLNDYYSAITSWLGTAGDTADSKESDASTLLAQADTLRQSQSSVSLDDEMSNMVVYQKAYNASAKVISTMDTMLESLLSQFD